ncbi:hypothetical protein [Ruegeria arenilitoris]|uniref:hypothetical protein n=1 Tax=Ruegeria arenilitoris TaxID=1173585 RepID=UPI00147E2F0C|nr:hypothetical protein [Ruegeria arenilitoris]
MLLRVFRHLSGVLVVSGLFVSISGNSVSARAWEMGFDQEQLVVANLQPMQLEIGSKPCPERFRPVRVSKEINLGEYGTFSVESKSSEHLLSTKIAKSRSNKVANLSAVFEFEGCAFRRHFLVRSGYVTLSGDLGFAAMVPTKLVLKDPLDQFAPVGMWYSAQLGGSPEIYDWFGSRKLAGLDLSTMFPEDEVLGVLTWGLINDRLLLVSDYHEKDWIELTIWSFKMVVLPEDGSD